MGKRCIEMRCVHVKFCPLDGQMGNLPAAADLFRRTWSPTWRLCPKDLQRSTSATRPKFNGWVWTLHSLHSTKTSILALKDGHVSKTVGSWNFVDTLGAGGNDFGGFLTWTSLDPGWPRKAEAGELRQRGQKRPDFWGMREFYSRTPRGCGPDLWRYLVVPGGACDSVLKWSQEVSCSHVVDTCFQCSILIEQLWKASTRIHTTDVFLVHKEPVFKPLLCYGWRNKDTLHGCRSFYKWLQMYIYI